MTPFELLVRVWEDEGSKLRDWLRFSVVQEDADAIVLTVLPDLFICGTKGVELPKGLTRDLYGRAVAELTARNPAGAPELPATWRRTVPLPTVQESMRLVDAYCLCRALTLLGPYSPWQVRTASMWLRRSSWTPQRTPRLPLGPYSGHAAAQLWAQVCRAARNETISTLLAQPEPHLLQRLMLVREYHWVDTQRYVRKEVAGGDHKQDHHPRDPRVQETAGTYRDDR